MRVWTGTEWCPPDAVEIASYYRCHGVATQCVGKQLWDNDRRRPEGLGAFYNYLTHVIFEGRGMEGKVRGLAPYGDPQALRLPQLIVDQGNVLIPGEWLEVFERSRAPFSYFKNSSGSFRRCADLAAAFGTLRRTSSLSRVR